jgi:hypothetical protein
MNSKEFIGRVSEAFHELFLADAELFDLGTQGINEQTLTFRLGLYLAREFRDHHVDCEYNRLWDGKKRCIRLGIKWMKPDVIVHRRRSDKSNLLCIEARKANNWKDRKTVPKDVENKLRALTHPEENYRYSLGLAWRITPSSNPKNHDAIWFVKGEQVISSTLANLEMKLTTFFQDYGN